MSFNPDPSKQAQEIVFFRKYQNLNHNSMHFHHNLIQQAPSQKHLPLQKKWSFPLRISSVNVTKSAVICNGKLHFLCSIRMYLDTKLSFQEHLDNIMSKVDKTIGLLCQLQTVLLHPSLVSIYKAFVVPHFDYGDNIYDQAYKESFHQKLESIQYIAALAITRAIRGILERNFIKN